jgi:adenylate kinase
MRVLILLGAPGAGKGTQAQLLQAPLGLPLVATGDIFRAAVRNGTELGKQARVYMERGELVPDGVTIEMLLERLAKPDAAVGAILDGFPRTRAQAEALDHTLADCESSVDAALLVDVPADDLAARLSGRWVCSAAGHPYHEVAAPPRVAGICDIDGSALIQRDDDKPEVVRARLEKQLGALEDVVDHYRVEGKLRVVDGTQPIEAVTADLLAAIRALPGWAARLRAELRAAD